MSELLQNEAIAREVAASVMRRSGFKLPVEVVTVVDEMLVEAAHDGISIAEGLAALVDDPVQSAEMPEEYDEMEIA